MNNKELISIFNNYISNFDIRDSAIKLKYYHSIRVMFISEFIANSLNLNKDDVVLAKYIGLLHDYGRFTQWAKYNTYNDFKSIDHAELGVNILFKKDEITKYNINNKNYNIIYNSILYHNKYKIKSNFNKDEKMFLLMIRDADKLDILNIMCGKKYSFNDFENVHDAIKKDFFNRKILDRKKVRNEFEKYLLHLAMVFELEFKYSYEYLNKNKIIEKIYNNLENKEKYKEYFDYLNKYIEERIDSYVR